MRIAMNKLRVWQRANDAVLDNTRDRLIVWPHHPDQLRRPASRPGVLHADNLRHALAWNVFPDPRAASARVLASASTGTVRERAIT